MLRPEQMSKVSMAGSRTVMRDVIEAIHELRLVHFSDYDGTIEGFDTGTPLSGAEDAADRLVTVRSLKNTLEVTEEDAGPTRIVTEADIAEELPTVREAVNEFDDRRAEIREDLRSVEDAIETAEPFVHLGLDLELLGGYETLEVAVGEGDAEELSAALADHEECDAYGLESSNGIVAAFVYPASGASGVLDDAIVGVEFERLEVPDATGDPASYVAELEHRREQLESRLDRVENELDELRLEYAGFLLAAEEKLSIEVQQTEIPLQFATTDHAFVAEGWIPTDRYEELETTVEAAADEKIELEELEVAEYREYANSHHAPAEETEAAADGGVVFEADDEPPVIQDNPGLAKPFEVIVEAINRPRYSEYDPTLLVLFTFPLFFGFMIGDIGYGLIYVAAGYAIAARTDSEAVRSLGGVAIWSGVFTILFGFLYGEFFGLHFVADLLWGGSAPMHKGFQPHYIAYARAWLLLTLAAGLVHVTGGYVLSFLKDMEHGLKDAVYESGSWALLMLGVWAWIFSRHGMEGKPAFIYEVFNQPTAEIPAENVAYALGFAGLPESVGVLGLAVAAIGLGLLLLGEGIVGALESLNVLVNILSYTRIAAVLLAKAGMALVVNLLFFGAYTHDGEFHFLINETPQHAIAEFGEAAIMFPGLIHMGAIGILGGVVVLVVGHIIVLGLGITSAGLQAVRLEYVEFFGKFYDGGGAKYHPFGHQRNYTTED
ncbi:MAG: V-type ATP synthase subunit I [Halobacteriota archaeon]